MLIKSIELNNIRSYVNQKIGFNDGIVVLSGDIGSGKTSVLLAVEFALFGIGDSGSGLLRKGANEGSVELRFEINNKEYTIKRILKRKSDGIRQENGYIIFNNTKKDMTPTELKQFVVSLLGYPQESLGKKSSIYRYTTYTPQDEMKSILFEDSEERINIIRKIFGIDRYNRIIENSAIFARHLRENKRELAGKTADLEIKKDNLKSLNLEKDELMKKEKEADGRLNAAKKKTGEIKAKITALEGEMRKTAEIKREKAEIENSIRHKHEQNELLKKEIVRLENDLVSLKEKTAKEKIEMLKKKIKAGIKEEIKAMEKEQLALQKLNGEIEGGKKNSDRLKSQINGLKDCPLCLQKVSHEHKESIISAESRKLEEAEKSLLEISRKMNEIRLRLEEKHIELNESASAEKELSLIEIHAEHINEKEEGIKDKKELIAGLNDEIAGLRIRNEMIKPVEFDEDSYSHVKNAFDDAQREERLIEIEKTRISSDIKNNERIGVMIKKEIDEKEMNKIKLNKITAFEGWLQNNFVNIISLMEKHVMGSIYFIFNDTFKEMFELLIDDERITTRIDDSFTPVIEQNSYETEFENLSGGEKTSVSLAYRLALHKALNDISSDIQTKGLLLLDEPTDGFSSEQIDKMKDLFEKLGTSQTIIVSHESKIESIADNVVRIAKTGHESSVLL